MCMYVYMYMQIYNGSISASISGSLSASISGSITGGIGGSIRGSGSISGIIQIPRCKAVYAQAKEEVQFSNKLQHPCLDPSTHTQPSCI